MVILFVDYSPESKEAADLFEKCRKVLEEEGHGVKIVTVLDEPPELRPPHAIVPGGALRSLEAIRRFAQRCTARAS